MHTVPSLALATVLFATTSHAQRTNADPRTGWFYAGRLAYSRFATGEFSLVSHAPLEHEGDFGGSIRAGIRPIPVISAALQVDTTLWGFHDATGATGLGPGIGMATAVAFQGRLHLWSFLEARPARRRGVPDFYVGAGFGGGVIHEATQPGYFGMTVTRTVGAVVLPFEIGFEYAVADFMALGVSAVASTWIDPVRSEADLQWLVCAGVSVFAPAW